MFTVIWWLFQIFFLSGFNLYMKWRGVYYQCTMDNRKGGGLPAPNPLKKSKYELCFLIYYIYHHSFFFKNLDLLLFEKLSIFYSTYALLPALTCAIPCYSVRNKGTDARNYAQQNSDWKP